MIRKFFPVLLLIFAGCSASGIKIGGSPVKQEVYPMFGRTFTKDFYTPVNSGDSLKLKWEAEVNGSFPQSSVTIYGSFVFVNDLSGRVFCFDINTGKIKGQLKHKGPVYTTPVINRYSIVYIETLPDEDKSIFRIYNFLEGKFMSEKGIPGRVQSEMILVENYYYFITEKGLLYKFNNIGEQEWSLNLKGSSLSGLVSDGKSIYLFLEKEFLSIDPAGKINYRKKLEFSITSGITISGDVIFAGSEDGMLTAINKSGGDLIWKYESGAKITAVPVIRGEGIFTVNLNGDISSVDINNGKENWKTKTGGLLNSTPLVTDKMLIIPDMKNRILFTDVDTGEIIKVLELPNRAKLSPVISGNLLFIGYDRGVLRVYEII